MHQLRKNQHGFTHHLLLFLMILFVAGAAFIGAKRIYELHALVNPTYVVAVQNQPGCVLAGRPWNSTTSDCGSSCRTNQGTYSHITGSDGISRGYCTAAVAETMSDTTCVNTYHRYYIKEIGCARRANQTVNKDNAPQCQPAYPRYTVAGTDNCIAPNGPLPSVRVATFNILGASHTVPPDPRATTIGDYQSRMAEAFKVIDGQKFDVVGLQEMQSVQRQLFDSTYANFGGVSWGVYPIDGTDYTHDIPENSIIWNKARFSFVSGITVPDIMYLTPKTDAFPVVILKDLKTGGLVVFGNLHMTPGTDISAASARYNDAQIVRNTAESYINQGYPVIFTGDFNSQGEIRPQDVAFAGTNRYKIPYCYIGKDATMAHAYDLLLKRNKADGTCPPDSILLKIDQIWANTDSTVTNYYPFQSADTKLATDHDYVPYADIVPEAPSP